MARHTSANYTNFAFTWGDAAADLFKKEDVELLAQATEAHDHTSGKGLAVGTVISGLAIANPAFSGTASGSLTNLALTTPAFTGVATGDATLKARLLTFVNATRGAFASVTVNSAVNTTLTTLAITCDTPSNALVLMVGSISFGAVTNPNKYALNFFVTLSGGTSLRTGNTNSVHFDTTPLDGALNWSVPFMDVLSLPNGATTVTVQAVWSNATGPPSVATINNDGRYTGLTLIQLN